MIGSIIRWLRFTLPPAWIVMLAVAVPLFMEGLYLWAKWCLSEPECGEKVPLQFMNIRDGYAVVMMAAYGIFRAAAFHPLSRPKYRTWLEQTPWASHKPLPLGPIHLIGQDIVLLCIVMFSLHGSTDGPLRVFEGFFIAYLGTLGFSFWQTGPWWMGYVVLFGLGLTFRLMMYPVAALSVLAAMYPVALVGCQWLSGDSPGPSSKILEDFRRAFVPASAARQKAMRSWPFTQLLEVPPENKVLRRDGFLAPFLAAWWLYALASNAPDSQSQFAISCLPFMYGSGFAVMIRLMTYIGPSRPPISIVGRIATCRLIIPAYDHVLIAPLCMVLAAILGSLLGIKLGREYASITGPLALAAVLIIALNMGPSLRKWQLTGHHRIAPWSGGNKDPNCVKL